METFSFDRKAAGSLLGIRPFRRLLAAQFCAVTAAYSLSLASLTLVEQQAQSSAWTAATILSAILPAFLGSLVAGAVVDRLGRVRVLRASHLGRALVAVGFAAGAFAAAASVLSPAWIPIVAFAATATMALLTQFAMPAEFALLPDLVRRERLTAANALLQISWLLAEGLGIVALGPLVIKVAGPGAVGMLGGLLCLASLALVLTLPRNAARAADGAAGRAGLGAWVADMEAGWREIVRDRLLLLVALEATLAATLLLVILSLVPGLAARTLGLGPEDTPFLLLPGGVGFGLGALLVSRREGLLSRPAWTAAGLLGLGAGTGLLGLASNGPGGLWLSLPCILLAGLGLALVIIPARTTLQERPPAHLRGRVVAAQLALGNAAALLPVLLGGTLADQVGIGPALGLLGVLAAGAGVAGLYWGRRW
jgi:DHA3 family macrolide efflux protein-like MFS transporter